MSKKLEVISLIELELIGGGGVCVCHEPYAGYDNIRDMNACHSICCSQNSAETYTWERSHTGYC